MGCLVSTSKCQNQLYIDYMVILGFKLEFLRFGTLGSHMFRLYLFFYIIYSLFFHHHSCSTRYVEIIIQE
jgi:cell shape-determining protein MreD